MVEGGETCSGDISCDAGFSVSVSVADRRIAAARIIQVGQNIDASIALGINAASAGEE